MSAHGRRTDFLSCIRLLTNVFTPRANRRSIIFNRNKKIQLSNSLDVLQFTGEENLQLFTTCFIAVVVVPA